MHAYEFPKYDEPMLDFRGKNVAVIGGGNTALDAIRSALRLGAGNPPILYRRSEAEMPARIEEVKDAQQEGIEFQVLAAPLEFLDDGKGWLAGARCQKMALGEPDASGGDGVRFRLKAPNTKSLLPWRSSQSGRVPIRLSRARLRV